MNKDLLIVILISLLCLPSVGQVRVIEKDETEYAAIGEVGNLGEELLLYREIYGQYPKDKDTLIDFIMDECRYKSIDSLSYLNLIEKRRKRFIKLLKNRNNRYSTTGDTCSFYISKTRSTLQCVGGIAEMQKSDSYLFRIWTFSRFYDYYGNHLWSRCSESPFMPRDIRMRFSNIVTTDPKGLNEQDITHKQWTPPVLIPITMTRNGEFSYDVSCLNGLQLYYQKYGQPYENGNTIGSITIEDAIDSKYLEAMKAYLKDFMDKHEDIYSIKLWELVLFNYSSDTRMVH